MKAFLAGAVIVAISASAASAATCYRPNPAGGSIPYECPRGEELKADAPSLGESSLPTSDERELDAIRKLMEGATAAEEPAEAAPQQ